MSSILPKGSLTLLTQMNRADNMDKLDNKCLFCRKLDKSLRMREVVPKGSSHAGV